MKLNIQLFAKKEILPTNQAGDEITKDDELTSEEKVAELTVDLDLQRENYEKLENDFKELSKKYEDIKKANTRLMTRISEREDYEDSEKKKEEIKHSKITDLYDFKSGVLKLKK